MTKRYLLHLIEMCREMVGKKKTIQWGVLSFYVVDRKVFTSIV